jgi:hypothetical protein
VLSKILETRLSHQASVDGEVCETRNAIVSFLSRCDISLPTVEVDHNFDATCRTAAVCRGYPMEGTKSLAPFIPGGVAMATTAYAHLTNKSTQIFISLYTAFLIYIDDIFQYDIDAVREFNERFVLRKSQGDQVLDCFANLLLELPKHFSRVAANIMITSTLNLVTALLLEYETRGMAVNLRTTFTLFYSQLTSYCTPLQLRADAHGYPTFSRVISGASEAYALFGFPPELALPTFIQALPEVMIYINNGKYIIHPPPTALPH